MKLKIGRIEVEMDFSSKWKYLSRHDFYLLAGSLEVERYNGWADVCVVLLNFEMMACVDWRKRK